MNDDPRDLLAGFLADVVPGRQLVAARRGPVGNGQEIWFCQLDDARDEPCEVVVRRSAASGPLDWTDRAAEFRTLRWLASVEIPTPRVFHFEPDGGRLTRAAIVMEHLAGRPANRAPDSDQGELARSLGHHLATLHAAPAGDAPFVVDVDRHDATAQALAAWETRYREAVQDPIPILSALLGWLTANRPERAGPSVVVWGDPGLHNALASGHEITALLDWELAHAGDPLEDLGAAVWAVRSTTDPAILVESYEDRAEAGVDRAALEWFVVYAGVTRAIMLANGLRNLLDGRLSRPSLLGLTVSLFPQILLDAAADAGWPAPTVEFDPDMALPPRGPQPGREAIDRIIATYLADEVLVATDDPLIRRNLKTAVALLQSNALGHTIDGEIEQRRLDLLREVMETIEAHGVEVGDRDITDLAVAIETGDASEPLRSAVRRYLVNDRSLADVAAEPVRRLYGG